MAGLSADRCAGDVLASMAVNSDAGAGPSAGEEGSVGRRGTSSSIEMGVVGIWESGCEGRVRCGEVESWARGGEDEDEDHQESEGVFCGMLRGWDRTELDEDAEGVGGVISMRLGSEGSGVASVGGDSVSGGGSEATVAGGSGDLTGSLLLAREREPNHERAGGEEDSALD